MVPWEGVSVPCFGKTDLFYCAEDKINEVRKAKNICRTKCPITKACEHYAIAHGIQFGIWGGYLPDEREARAPFLEYLEPTIYGRQYKTLDALMNRLREHLSFPEHTSSPEIHIRLAFGSSVVEPTSNGSDGTEIESHQSGGELLHGPIGVNIQFRL